MKRDRLPLKPGLLNRPRIREILAAGLDYPLVTLVGGPGYGKTQAVAQFATDIRQRLIWLNLTQLDNNSEHFWNNLVSSIGHELPEFAAILRRHEFPGTIREFDRHIIEAAGALEFAEDTVFVVDNFGVISDGPVRLFLETLIRMQLVRLCVFLISGKAQDRQFAEALVGQDYLEITPQTLRFTQEEARLLFQYAGVPIRDSELEQVMEDTEGWPLAIYLLCQQCAKGGANVLPPRRLPVMLERLFEHGFFQAYSPEYQQMLVGFAFLPSFSLEMGRQVLRDDSELPAASILGNVFITYDYDSRTFSFHKMYQDFLQHRRHLLPAPELTRIYAIAGDWFYGEGLYLAAVDCYFLCGHFDEMVQAVLMLPGPYKDVATTNHMLSHLEKLPASYMKSHPLARFCMAFLYANRLEMQTAKALLMEVGLQLEETADSEEEEQLLGEVYAALGDICLLMNDNTCFEYFDQASTILLHGSLYHGKTMFYVGNNNVLFLAGRRPGLLRETVERVMATAQTAGRYMRGQAHGFEYLFAAEAAYATGDVALAREHIRRAITKAGKEQQHDIVCNAYYLQMRCVLYQGDNAGIDQTLKAHAEHCDRWGIDLLDEIYDISKAWLYLRLDMPDEVARWISEYDDDRYMRQPIAMGRNMLVHAHYLMEKQRYQDCVSYLDGMEWLYEEKGLWTIRLGHYILKAVCLACLGDEKKAVAHLHRAYEMSYGNGIYLYYVEYGGRMQELLDLADKQQALSFSPEWLQRLRQETAVYAENVLAIQKERKRERVRHQPKRRLSKREYEVLCHMVHGKTRGEIAQELGIAASSVKTHIAGVYSKLGAVNRADATRLAISLGMIPDAI